MKKEAMLTLLLALTLGCATVPKSAQDVSIGDNLQATAEGYTDCNMEVKVISVVEPTPLGYLPMNPVVCGTVTCDGKNKGPSWDECYALTNFMEQPSVKGN